MRVCIYVSMYVYMYNVDCKFIYIYIIDRGYQRLLAGSPRWC